MTTSEAAKYTGLHASRLRQEAKKGSLVAERVKAARGIELWFLPSDLDRWMEARRKANEERQGRRGRPLKLRPPSP